MYSSFGIMKPRVARVMDCLIINTQLIILVLHLLSWSVLFLPVSAGLTQVKMEKKEKAMAALAASAPWFKGSSSGVVRCHWLAKKQKPTNHRNVQKPEKIPPNLLNGSLDIPNCADKTLLN